MNGYLAVIDILRLDGPVGLLIGGSGLTTARVFPGDPPQKAIYPLITVDTFDGEPFDTKDGVSVLDHDLVKVSCYSTIDAEAFDLATKCRNCLDGTSGTYNELYIENIRFLRPVSYDINETNRRIRVHEADYEVRVVLGDDSGITVDVVIEDEGTPV